MRVLQSTPPEVWSEATSVQRNVLKINIFRVTWHVAGIVLLIK